MATHPAITTGAAKLLVLPDFVSLPSVVSILGSAAVGAQNVSAYGRGPYTGEVSAESLAEIGVSAAEIGHAERRMLFSESEDVVRAKVTAAAEAGLTPLICVGETDPSDSVEAGAQCAHQLKSAVAGIDDGGQMPVIVAYEPVWAIGETSPAPDEHIRYVCRQLTDLLVEARLPVRGHVIYGGSAQPGLLSRLRGDVDGLFLGRYAHDPDAVSLILDEAVALSQPSFRLID